MRIIRSGDPKIAKIMENNGIVPEETYHISKFVCLGEANGRYFLKHTLSQFIFELDRREWEVLVDLREKGADGKRLGEAGLEWLGKYRVVVGKGFDEDRLYEIIRMAIGTARQNGKGLRSYLILPTTGCNARCVYCYEAGFTPHNMTDQTAERLIRFILETKAEGEIKLRWFGGEPLVASNRISWICNRLRQEGVTFQSEMVTNAILFTKELAREAREVWNLKKAQVSVDGARKDYEERKCFCDPVRHNYDTLFQAVHAMLDEGIEVTFRCNYDAENIDGIKDFIDDVDREFPNKELYYFYFGLLMQAGQSENAVALYARMRELYQYLGEKGIRHHKSLGNKKMVKLTFCMADADECVIVDPQGRLFRCEHMPEEDVFGSIFDDPQTVSFSRAQLPIEEECRECPFLPECTPFRKKGCPTVTCHCRTMKELDFQYGCEALSKM